MTLDEAVAYLRRLDVNVDSFTLKRWIRERKVRAFRLKNNNKQWYIPIEDLISLVLDKLRK